LPGLRENQPGTGAIPCDPARMGGAKPAGQLLYEKFGQHQPLNRQTERYALEGVPISLSTAADAVGACCTVLEPLLRLLEAHVMASERLHGDDSVLQKHTERMIEMI